MKNNQRTAGILLNYAGEAVKVLTALIYTPIMLRLLGQSEYGLYQLVSSTVAYLSLLSLGFGSAYIRFYSRYAVKNDHDGVARLNGMFMLIFCIMSALCVVCGGVMIVKAEWVFGSGLTVLELQKAKMLMAILVFSMALTFPNSVFSCYVTAHERFVFQKTVNLLQWLLNPFLALPLLLLGYGSVAVVGVSAFLTTAVFLSNILFCRKKLQMRFSFRGFDFGLLKEMWVFTFFIFLNQIIDQVNWNVDKFLLGRMVGTSAVAVYGIGGQINSLYIAASTAVSNVFVPKVNRIVATTDDNGELTEMMIRIGRIQFMILALVVTGFIFFGQSFIQLWAGEEYGSAYAVALLLIVPVTIPLIQNIGIEIQRAKNMHRARSVVYTALALCNVMLSIPLIKRFGVEGAALGTAVSMLLGNGLFMNWYYYRRMGLNMIAFWKSILRCTPAVAAASVFGLLQNWLWHIDSWGTLLLGIVGYTAVYGILVAVLGFDEYEKNMAKKLLSHLCQREI
ncbi:MAG: oligosaccharide flippase family protein [Oscillospiraceae bacterium]|nr:oligosaccharide flippase family protein [Oscillospiraceae bacterium]